MYRLFLLLFSFSAFAAEIEVRLPTASPVKPAVVSRFERENTELDENYVETLRNILVFDLNTGGFLSVQSSGDHHFRGKVTKHTLELSVGKKTYSGISLTGKLDADRKTIHRLSDQMHKDLFQSEGVAALRLVYSVRDQDANKAWVSEIWMQEADGAAAKRVTFENSYCITPSFYPHTAGLTDPSFVFVSYKGGQSKIYRAKPSGKPESLIELRGSQLLPAINRQGTHIAFISDAAGRPDLFVQALDGSMKAKQLFSAPRASQASPTFSPDGRKIAFVSDKDGSPRIYCMDVVSKRTRVQLLTQKNRENISPSWSPDGKKLAFSAKVDGVRQIWIYDFETGEEMPLTGGAVNKENPAWAPDSLHLVFNTDEDEEGELFLINLHQREAVQITKGPGQKRFASWETR